MASFSFHVLTFSGDELVQMPSAVDDALNSLGAEGWDVLGLVRREDQDQVVVFLRRTN